MNFLRQRKREANEKDEQRKQKARTERNYESGDARKKIKGKKHLQMRLNIKTAFVNQAF